MNTEIFCTGVNECFLHDFPVPSSSTKTTWKKGSVML